MSDIDHEIQKKIVARAEAMLNGMMARDYHIATEHFDSNMSSLVPGVKLQEMWATLQEKAGRFQRNLGIRTAFVSNTPVAFILCEFEKGNVEMRVTFDEHANVAGLFFAPASAAAQADAPEDAEAPEAPEAPGDDEAKPAPAP